jgi:hypothetical protein
MGATVGELKVVVQITSTQHDAIEAVVVLEPSNFDEAKPFAVHNHRAVERANWPSDSKLSLHDSEVTERSNDHAQRPGTSANSALAGAHRS